MSKPCSITLWRAVIIGISCASIVCWTFATDCLISLTAKLINHVKLAVLPWNCLFADLIRSNHSNILWLSSNSIKMSVSGATRLSTERDLSLYSAAWKTRHVLIGTRSVMASLTINLTSSNSSSISPRRQFRTFHWFEKDLVLEKWLLFKLSPFNIVFRRRFLSLTNSNSLIELIAKPFLTMPEMPA